jgi:hypothetical protein
MSLLVPTGLYLLALIIRLLVAGELPFPTTEPSAYYVDVARNFLGGDGLVSDGLWSYATPPLEVPKPAFELWLPMSTFVSAAAMSVLGTSYWAAQVGGALLGALVAPLAWGIAREASRAQALDTRRRAAVAIASGLLAAVLSPLVLGSVVPDSYMPFTIFMLVSALLLPRVLGVGDGIIDPHRRPVLAAGVGLGMAMGLAYLSRQEVIWMGLTVLLMMWWVARSRPPGTRLRDAIARLWPVVLGGLIVVVPWLARNSIDLGSPFPGQAVENLFLVENEDIFAFAERPSAGTYLDQGIGALLWNPVAAAWDSFLNVIALPAFPVGLLGLVALVGMRHSPALRRPTALVAVLISAAFTFVSTIMLFPVATLWGTFMHASGPLLVALIVAAGLGGDALLTRISAARDWDRPNVILAPIALLAVAGVLAFFQVRVFSEQSRETEARYSAISAAATAAAAELGGDVPATLITDHPMWLADALDRRAIALPDEDLDSITDLSDIFEAPWVVVVGERGRYPAALLDPGARPCLSADPIALTGEPEPAWLFQLQGECPT